MRSFFLPNWSPPDDPARPLPAEGRPWPSDYDYDDDNDHDDDDDQVRSLAEWQEKKLSDLLCKPGPRIVLCRSLSF